MTDRDVTPLDLPLDDEHWDTLSGDGAAPPVQPPKAPERPALPSSNAAARKPAPPAPSRVAAEAGKGPRPATPASPASPAGAAAPSPPKLPVRSPMPKPGDVARPVAPLAAKPAPVATARAAVVPPRAMAPAALRDVKPEATAAPAVGVAAPAPVLPAARSAEAPRLEEKPEATPPSEPSHVRGAQPRPEAPSPGAADNRDWLAHLVEAAVVEERRSTSGEGEPAPSRAHTSNAMSRSPVASSAVSTAREVRGALPSASARSMPTERGLCAFWVQDRCFALDVDLVGEVVNVDSVVPVPVSHPAMIGLFNLRGTPVALVDLSLALSLDQRSPAARPASTKSKVALVFRSSRMVAAAIIDRMEAVYPAGSHLLTMPGATDSPLVKGFIEPRKHDGVTITVLDHPAVVERLERLKY